MKGCVKFQNLFRRHRRIGIIQFHAVVIENADGERWFAWNELKALFEPVDVQEEEIWIWYEEDC